MSNVLPDPWQMSNLTSRFYECLDARDYLGVVSCFAEDGVWFRRGIQVCGHQAIREALDARPPTFHTTHQVTNVRVELSAADEGFVCFCMTGYPYSGKIEAGNYVARPAPHIVATYRDTMRKVRGKWLIVEKRNIRTAFKDGQHLP